jgi:predicted N-acetyltransferase YhbS
MRLSFANADFETLTTLWNEFYPERYRIDADLLRLNTVQSAVFDWGASSVWYEDSELCGLVSVKKSASALYAGPDQDTAHLSAIVYRDPRIGVDLLADVKRTLRNRGLARLVFGQDSRHFFPGCPVDFRSLEDFLMVEGFQEGGLAHDLERDLSTYVNPYGPVDGAVLRPVETDDIPALQEFFEREFPGRWNYDIMHKVRLEQSPSCVFGLFFGPNAEGFALLQDGKAKIPIGGAVWRNDLGADWGSLGPIGVSARLRGKGSGGALLGAALDYLKQSGARQCIIDWTGLVDFYGKFGFQVTRTYKSMALSLEA